MHVFTHLSLYLSFRPKWRNRSVTKRRKKSGRQRYPEVHHHTPTASLPSEVIHY